jgi:TPR repeat protein
LRLAAFFVLLAAPCLADVPQGQGAAPSADEVVGWWRMGADQGDANAQAALGHFYTVGMVVPRDEVAASLKLNVTACAANRV